MNSVLKIVGLVIVIALATYFISDKPEEEPLVQVEKIVTVVEEPVTPTPKVETLVEEPIAIAPPAPVIVKEPEPEVVVEVTEAEEESPHVTFLKSEYFKSWKDGITTATAYICPKDGNGKCYDIDVIQCVPKKAPRACVDAIVANHKAGMNAVYYSLANTAPSKTKGGHYEFDYKY